jgi:hypothetical protein
MAFDYEAPDVPATAVADVVAAIVNDRKLPPLSDEEREQRRLDHQLYIEECRERDEQWRIEYQQEQAAKAERERAEWLVEHRKQEAVRQRERRERIDRETRDRELANLRLQSAQQAAWQRNVENAARTAMNQQYRNTLMGELERMINPLPSPPEPEPEIVYLDKDEMGSPRLGDRDFNPQLWTKRVWR